MERKIYEPTQKQLERWESADAKVSPMPTDEKFQAMWKRKTRKLTGWGIAKRDWIVSEMKNTSEYQRGIWQGRVDCATGFGYSEERSESAYNLGYYRGYSEYESRGTGGWDLTQAAEFKAKYVA